MTDTRVADRYEPLEVVGRGGEATVLKAVDTRHQRLVALKVRVVPHNGSSDELLTEARALLSLPPHPGLAHARDDLFDGGRHVLVLDWVDGVNLARLLADEGRPGLPVSSVLRWIAQAAEALTVLHQHSVVHGDVKPANLILDRNGRVVLVDLGSSSVPVTEDPAVEPRGSALRRSPAGHRPIARVTCSVWRRRRSRCSREPRRRAGPRNGRGSTPTSAHGSRWRSGPACRSTRPAARAPRVSWSSGCARVGTTRRRPGSARCC